jgi:hypothetical protein
MLGHYIQRPIIKKIVKKMGIDGWQMINIVKTEIGIDRVSVDRVVASNASCI